MDKRIMVDDTSLNNFVFFQYKPFKGKELIKYSLSTMGAAAVFFVWHKGSSKALFLLVLSVICVFAYSFSFVFCKDSPKSRFISDGIAFSFFAIMLNLESSQLLGAKGQKWISTLFLILLIISAIIYILISISNIKHNTYAGNASAPVLTSLLGSTIGYLGAILFLPSVSQSAAEKIIAFLLLALSLMVNAGVVSFLKLFYYCKMRE